MAQSSSRQAGQFTLEFVSRECSGCRDHLINLYRSNPDLVTLGSGIIPRDSIMSMVNHSDGRLLAREAMTRLHRIAVGCEAGILVPSIVANLEGAFIVNTTVRWAHFLVHMRSRPGFETAYDALLRLVRTVCENRVDNSVQKPYWNAVAAWADDPAKAERLARVQAAVHGKDRRAAPRGGPQVDEESTLPPSE